MAPSPLNLLLIMFDDLRPELSVYGQQHMITPNFERLANRSVVFDKAISQVAVCNPSRDSLLTGLRPDTVGTVNFQSSFHPHYVFQNQLVKNGYATAGYGKIQHWENDSKELWSVEGIENDWYGYQNFERGWVNSTTFPDKIKPESEFRDSWYTTKAIERLEKFFLNPSQKFMLALGFKSPHLQMHMPYKYYEMYKNTVDHFELTKRELRFPHSAPEVGFRCCAEMSFNFMNEEGAKRFNKETYLNFDVNYVFTDQIREELMIGYCAAISFVDNQLGRVLDVMDKYDGWKNTVVILTADHGMHNGEKGMWEKWTLFDEATRVPLFIYHPLTPFPNQHYTEPVELIDIYPTINDLLLLPYNHSQTCFGLKMCHVLQGKSLAPVVLGEEIYHSMIESNPNVLDNKKRFVMGRNETIKSLHMMQSGRYLRASVNSYNFSVDFDWNHFIIPGGGPGSDYYSQKYYYHPSSLFSSPHSEKVNEQHVSAELNHAPRRLSTVPVMPKLNMTFAISQCIRCVKKERLQAVHEWRKNGGKGLRPNSDWHDCDVSRIDDSELSVMGYSMRTSDFRYTAWFYYNRRLCLPILDAPTFDEELYDHRGERLHDFTHLEIVNLAHRAEFLGDKKRLHNKLVNYLRNDVLFRGCFY